MMLMDDELNIQSGDNGVISSKAFDFQSHGGISGRLNWERIDAWKEEFRITTIRIDMPHAGNHDGTRIKLAIAQ
ncbi:hypothetical protein QQP08_023948 [Theobroma cacao]|nr:hypothetical protein QQP08_022839 [Theobroma cacao]WRX31456.1 hypothetical protein QQP08_023943 [Theobroma cacao]WRX31461.1 hypothetical protein QQP08_023948 [Theobroma cacao]